MSELILKMSNPKRAKFVRWVLVPVPYLPAGDSLVAVGEGGEILPCIAVTRNLLAVRARGYAGMAGLSKWVVRSDVARSEQLPADQGLFCSPVFAEIAAKITLYEGGRRHDFALRDLRVNLSARQASDEGRPFVRFVAVEGDADFAVKFWADVYPDTNIVDWWVTITYASGMKTEFNITVDSLRIEIPSAVRIDTADSQVWTHDTSVRSVRLCRNATLHDGASVAVRGTALISPNQACVENYNALIDAGDGIFMVATEDSWEGHWVAPYGNVPRIMNRGAAFEASIAVARREKYLAGNLRVDRNLDGAALASGAIKYPGQQGDQLDFGVTYGAIELADPAAIALLEQRVCADFLRGYMLTRPSFSMGTIAGMVKDVVRSDSGRPNWLTYNGRTWDRSEDLLDKVLPFNPANGWQPYDEQHRSHNQLAAYLCLVHDPRVIELTRMMVNVDFADVRYVQRTQPSPRGIGRQIGSWAQLHLATNKWDYRHLAENLILRTKEVGPIEAWGQQMDAYGVVRDYRYPVFDSSGMVVPVVSVWEHALMLFGVHQFLAAPGLEIDSNVQKKGLKMARDCARVVLMSLRDGEVCTAFSTFDHEGKTLTMRPGNQAGTAWWVILASYLARMVYADDQAAVPTTQIDEWNLHFPIPSTGSETSAHAEWLAALPRSRSQIVPSKDASSSDQQKPSTSS